MTPVFIKKCPDYIKNIAVGLAENKIVLSTEKDITILGSGLTSVVYGIGEFAIKVYKEDCDATYYSKEAEVLAKLQGDPTVVRLYGYEESKYIIMERINGDTLEKNNIELTTEQQKKVALSIYNGYDNGVIYKDISKSNIMIRENEEPVIVDVGSFRTYEKTENEMQSFVQLKNVIDEIDFPMINSHEELRIHEKMKNELPFFDDEKLSIFLETKNEDWGIEIQDYLSSGLIEVCSEHDWNGIYSENEIKIAKRRKRKEVYATKGIHILIPSEDDLLFLRTFPKEKELLEKHLIVCFLNESNIPDVIRKIIHRLGVKTFHSKNELINEVLTRVEVKIKDEIKKAVRRGNLQAADELKRDLKLFKKAVSVKKGFGI